jgi:hypothetical protein
MKKLHDAGFVHLEIVIVVTVMLAVGAVAGYLVKNKTHADTNGAAVCGANYVKYDGTPLPNFGYDNPQAAVRLFENSGKHTICALLVSLNKADGVSKPMTLTLDYTYKDGKQGSKKDSGNYKYYAGPLYISTVDANAYLRTLTVKGTMTFNGTTKSATWFKGF